VAALLAALDDADDAAAADADGDGRDDPPSPTTTVEAGLVAAAALGEGMRRLAAG